MYAVIETGGKQYRVAPGDKLKVEKLAADEGASVAMDRVLMVADGANVTVGSPTVDTEVSAKVISHGRADKIRVFKMKRRKNYRRTQGHRQAYTEIEITAIGGQQAEAAKPVAKAKKTAEKPATETAAAADDLSAISGIGPVIIGKLADAGITTLQQVADLDEAKIAEIDEQLNFKGRIEREEWVEQAKKLVGQDKSDEG